MNQAAGTWTRAAGDGPGHEQAGHPNIKHDVDFRPFGLRHSVDNSLNLTLGGELTILGTEDDLKAVHHLGQFINPTVSPFLC